MTANAQDFFPEDPAGEDIEPADEPSDGPTELMRQLTAIRKMRGFSQAAVARAMTTLMGSIVTQTGVSYWEAGRRGIRLGHAHIYAQAVGVRLVIDTDMVTAGQAALPPVEGDAAIHLALTSYPDDDERHWQLQAHLFTVLARQAQMRADRIATARVTALAELEGLQ